MRKTQVQFSPLPPLEQGFKPGLTHLCIQPFSYLNSPALPWYLKNAKVKIFDLAATVAEFNLIPWKTSFLKKKLMKIFLEDKTQQFEEWKNIGRLCSATHKYLLYGWDWPSIGIYSWKKYETADICLVRDELHNAVNETLAFSLKTYNMHAPEIQFSFQLCSLWRKLNDFNKHLPATKKCRKRKILTKEDPGNLWKIQLAFMQV